MNGNYETMSILIHGGAKIGKSTLSSTAPTPLLVLDAEGGWKYLKTAGFRSGVLLRRREWDPQQGPPPRADGTWDFCHVMVRNWSTLTTVLQWLTMTEHDFQSLIIDSISETQRQLKTNLVGTEQMKIQDWGALLTKMDALIRGYRDLVLLSGPLRLVVFIAETREDKGKWRPYMQGQIGVSLPYWVDVVGYLYVGTSTDDNGQQMGSVRQLLVGPHPQFESGERVQGVLGNIITDPHLTRMLDVIFPPNDRDRRKPLSEETKPEEIRSDQINEEVST